MISTTESAVGSVTKKIKASSGQYKSRRCACACVRVCVCNLPVTVTLICWDLKCRSSCSLFHSLPLCRVRPTPALSFSRFFPFALAPVWPFIHSDCDDDGGRRETHPASSPAQYYDMAPLRWHHGKSRFITVHAT